MSEINESKFYLWRSAVALTKVDGKVTKEELDWLNEYMKAVPFSSEQKQTLQNDLNGKTDFNEFIKKISDKKDRATLLHFANVIFRRDGEFHEDEKDLYEEIKEAVMAGVDLDAAAAESSTVTLKDGKSATERAFSMAFDSYTMKNMRD
jgi:tellurite resistance protein